MPALPMFLLIPLLLRRGVDSWPALALGCTLNVALYPIMLVVAARFGLTL